MMMTSDPIADMLTRIRNANTAKHDTVDIPDRKSTRLNSSHWNKSRMPSSA